MADSGRNKTDTRETSPVAPPSGEAIVREAVRPGLGAREDEGAVFRILADELNEIIYSLDAEGNILFVGPQVRHYGLDPEEIIGTSFREHIHPADRDRVAAEFAETMATNYEFTSQFRLQTGDGVGVWMEDYGRVKRDDEGEVIGLTGILRDITERKQAEEKLMLQRTALRRLTFELSLAEERERRRIASGLHDQVGQNLVACGMRLMKLSDVELPPEVKAEIDQVNKLLEQTLQETRSLTFDLCSPVLYEMGLGAGLEELCEQLSRQCRAKVRFEFDDSADTKVDTDVAVVLYRAVQELLFNVRKHARATNVLVSGRIGPEKISVAVKDNGNGLPSRERIDGTLAHNGGFGLFNVRERIESMGGSMKVVSEPGQGVLVELEVPRIVQMETPGGNRPGEEKG
jgi:PAS domain S-box-containing protein